MTNYQRIKTRRSTANRIISTVWHTMQVSWWPAIIIYAIGCAVIIAHRLGTP